MLFIVIQNYIHMLDDILVTYAWNNFSQIHFMQLSILLVLIHQIPSRVHIYYILLGKKLLLPTTLWHYQRNNQVYIFYKMFVNALGRFKAILQSVQSVHQTYPNKNKKYFFLSVSIHNLYLGRFKAIMLTIILFLDSLNLLLFSMGLQVSC